MKDLSNLWVGDKVRIHLSDHIGIFKGIAKDGQAIIFVESNEIAVPKEYLDLIEEELNDPRLTSSFSLDSDVYQDKPAIAFDNNLLDLHIEKLAPEMKHALPERLRAFQVEKAKSFIEQMILNDTKHFTIIHGKGKGILKLEILHLLGNYPEIGFTFDRNDGGATEIWLKPNTN